MNTLYQAVKVIGPFPSLLILLLAAGAAWFFLTLIGFYVIEWLFPDSK